MIKDAPIVKDTRKVRSLISNRFGNDLDRYSAHLRAATPRHAEKSKNQVREAAQAYTPAPSH